MRVLYFGLYDPLYARNWVLINGLKKNGVEVVELRQKPARWCLLKLFFEYLRMRPNYDVMIVGFPGQEVMFLARILTRKPIIFDAFTSHYGGYILDRRKNSPKSLRAKYYRFLDTWSCKFADIVLLDTHAHIDFFVQEYKLPPEKFRRIWIGANDDQFQPITVNRAPDDVFRVIFFGTYVPLQGVEYIVKAAKILEHEQGILFTFIGNGQDKQKTHDLAERLKLKNILFKDMLDAGKLRQEIAHSDISLGIFGDTPKTPLVIPNKVYEALAMRKPVITADTPASRELFDGTEVMLVPSANEKAIAEAILRLKNNPAEREEIARRGYKKFVASASSNVLGGILKTIIHENLR